MSKRKEVDIITYQLCFVQRLPPSLCIACYLALCAGGLAALAEFVAGKTVNGINDRMGCETMERSGWAEGRGWRAVDRGSEFRRQRTSEWVGEAQSNVNKRQ